MTEDWYKEAVKWAASVGIVKGESDDVFVPNRPITREEMAVMLYRYAVYRGADVSKQDNLAKFPDADKVSGWAENEMKWAVGAGIINGVGITENTAILSPQGASTRAAAAKVLMCYYKIFP